MAKVLVTGAAGLFGANFTRHLLSHGHSVVAIDNLMGGYREFIDPRADFYHIDLCDSHKVSKIFHAQKPDYVYHFAAYAAEGLSPFIRSFNYQNNVIASSNVINGCINNGVKKIIFTSSMAVYGNANLPFTEDQVPKPEDPYGIAKYAVEMDLALASKNFGLRYSICRPHNVFGTYQNIWDRYRNVLGIWVRQALNNQDLTIFGDGKQTRAFSDIQYHMDPLLSLMDMGDGEIFNIGADKYTTINDAADTVCKVVNKHGGNVKIVRLEKRNEVHQAYCDHSKAKDMLSFVDSTDLDKLIDKLYIWATGQPNRPVKYLEYEIEKNIYSFWKKS